MTKHPVVLAFTILAVAAVGAGGMYWMSQHGEPTWTSFSVEAREELELGLDALMKYYWNEARGHFERALELDPEFAAAKIFKSYVLYKDTPEYQRLVAELRETDISRLSDRERFMVRYWLARNEASEEDPEKLLDDFLATHPGEPFALNTRCDAAWQDQNWQVAEHCYQDLIDRYPNWVRAQNRLGYIAMARGRFSEAEEHFKTYRYIAPDQANPYDSMGQLLTFLGRYEEAEEALHEALRIKDDFCGSYFHLLRLYIFSGQLEKARETLARLQQIEPCGWHGSGFACAYDAWLDSLAGDPGSAWQRVEDECLELEKGKNLLSHRIALLNGHADAAAAMESELRAEFERRDWQATPIGKLWFQAELAHMEGMRQLVYGEAAAASDRLREADELLLYWGDELASFKLFNRLNLVYSLELEGETAEAAALRNQIEAVNPRYMEGPQVRELEALLAAREAS